MDWTLCGVGRRVSIAFFWWIFFFFSCFFLLCLVRIGRVWLVLVGHVAWGFKGKNKVLGSYIKASRWAGTVLICGTGPVYLSSRTITSTTLGTYLCQKAYIALTRL